MVQQDSVFFSVSFNCVHHDFGKIERRGIEGKQAAQVGFGGMWGSC